MNDQGSLKAGIIFVLIIGGLLIINNKLSKEINKSAAPNKVTQPIVVEKPKASPKAEGTPQLVETQEPPPTASSVRETKEELPSESEKKIIYELPLDDVILVQ